MVAERAGTSGFGQALLMVMRVARAVGRRVGDGVAHLHQSRFEQVGFHFVPINIGQHVFIHHNTRGKALAALFDHLRAVQGVADNIAIFVSQIVFAHDRAHALTPATGGLQVGSDGWCFHCFFYVLF